MDPCHRGGGKLGPRMPRRQRVLWMVAWSRNVLLGWAGARHAMPDDAFGELACAFRGRLLNGGSAA
eukprot:12024004-Alexandrium_andersonii.AAC.1